MSYKNFYLIGLEHGEECLSKGQSISYNQLKAFLESKGFLFESEETQRLLLDFAREMFYMDVGMPGVWDEKPRFLNVEGYFKLLDYKELKEARASSLEARWIAIAAMIISIIVGIAQIVVGIIPIMSH